MSDLSSGDWSLFEHETFVFSAVVAEGVVVIPGWTGWYRVPALHTLGEAGTLSWEKEEDIGH